MTAAGFKNRADVLCRMKITDRGDESVNNMDLAMAEEVMERLNELNSEMQQQYMAVINNMAVEDEEKRECTELIDRADSAYMRGKVALRRRILELQPPVVPRAIPDNVIRFINKREPRLGKFNGDPHAWPAFRDVFLAEVHNRGDLEAVTKLSFLKTACIGKASDTLGLWSHTNEAYAGAWALLKDRFEDNYIIKQSLMKQFFDLPVLKEESYDGLSHMVNTVESVLRQLLDMNVATETWSPILMYMIVKRLPAVTADGWEQKRIPEVEPVLADMLRYVKGRARGRLHHDAQAPPKVISEEGQRNWREQPRRFEGNGRGGGRFKRSHSNSSDVIAVKKTHYANPNAGDATNPPEAQQVDNRKFDSRKGEDRNSKERPGSQGQKGGRKEKGTYPPCLMCKGEHYVGKCKTFLSLAVPKRLELLDQWGRCRSCFRIHGKGDCKWSGCYRCKGTHNIINCPVDAGQITTILAMIRESQQSGATHSSQ